MRVCCTAATKDRRVRERMQRTVLIQSGVAPVDPRFSIWELMQGFLKEVFGR
jgi:hypothetical protein